MWMTRKEHDVIEAPNGHEALHLCSKRHFDVVVLDLNMPGLSGLMVTPLALGLLSVLTELAAAGTMRPSGGSGAEP